MQKSRLTDWFLTGLFVVFDAVAIFNAVTARHWLDIAINALSVGALTMIVVLLWREASGRV